MPKKLTKLERERRAFGNKIRSCIRRAWSRSPSRYAAKSEKGQKRKYVGPNKRQKYEYRCNHCKKWFKDSDTQIDHIIPCGGFFNADYTINKAKFKEFCYIMFLGDLQRLCKPCHNIKTAEDRKNGKD